jgi:hypothetical protein
MFGPPELMPLLPKLGYLKLGWDYKLGGWILIN